MATNSVRVPAALTRPCSCLPSASACSASTGSGPCQSPVPMAGVPDRLAAGHAVMAEVDRRAARARSRRRRGVAGGGEGDHGDLPAGHAAGDDRDRAGRGGPVSPPGCGTLAGAAGTMAAEASRPQATAARAATSRRSRVAACRARCAGEVGQEGAWTWSSPVFGTGRVFRPLPAGSPSGQARGRGRITPFPRRRGPG